MLHAPPYFCGLTEGGEVSREHVGANAHTAVEAQKQALPGVFATSLRCEKNHRIQELFQRFHASTIEAGSR